MAAKKTTDVFAGFTIVIEDASGQRRGSLTPDEFRAAMGCPKTAFLADCVESWNARQAREGAEDRARIDMETRPSKREAAQFQRGRRIYEAGKRQGHATRRTPRASTTGPYTVKRLVSPGTYNERWSAVVSDVNADRAKKVRDEIAARGEKTIVTMVRERDGVTVVVHSL